MRTGWYVVYRLVRVRGQVGTSYVESPGVYLSEKREDL